MKYHSSKQACSFLEVCGVIKVSPSCAGFQSVILDRKTRVPGRKGRLDYGFKKRYFLIL